MGFILGRTAIACGVLLACGATGAGTAHAAGMGGATGAGVRGGGGAAHAAPPRGTVAAWQPPFAAPGLDGKGVPAQPDNGEVSCAGAGYCAMVGIFLTGRTDSDITAYAWDKSSGSWDTARQIPGLAALNTGGQAAADAVSCAAPGDCAAGGWYSPKYGSPVREPFVVSEVNGGWQTAQAVTGLPGLGGGGSARIGQLSCAAPGECTAAGSYYGGSQSGTFVVAEAHGHWGRAQPLPSVSALGGGEGIESLSCPSPGDCAAVGDDQLSDSAPAFVIEEVNGHWGSAARIHAMPALGAGLASVSCPSAGNCVAAGTYTADRYPDGTAMEVTETDGHWGSPRTLPGVRASSVSCPADGDCTVLTSGDTAETGGAAVPATGDIVDEVNGVWRRPLGTPGFTPGSASCTAPGYCSATGYYARGDVNNPAESAIGLIDETAGSWGPWQVLRDTVTYDYEPGAVIDPLSCGAPGNCALHGYYAGQYGPGGEWAAAKSLVPATATALAPPVPAPVYGREQAGRFAVTVLASSGSPAGGADVMSGQTVLCTARLTAGRGDCALAATELPGGRYHVAAYYGISAGFASSRSGQAALVIAKAPTVARLALTRYSAGFGREQAVLIRVSVTPGYAGVPAGQVSVMAGRAPLCTIRLSARKGSCSPGSRILKPGRYRLTARYEGSGDFSPSRSAPRWLVVLPR